ncbi:MAG: fumarylacetoacetate hydrolase family protein [Betaproteobacteria bacterium]|nr:fumarylacetoacetate hydrolase family protein [Betaproteobacteria bacterium]
MKLLRYGPPGMEKPGLLGTDGVVRDLGGHVRDIDAAALSPASLAGLARLDPDDLPAVPAPGRLGPCVAPGGKIVGIGLNYADHAREAGMALPTEPVVFMKAVLPSGPADPIPFPGPQALLDWEIELAVVIGTRALEVGEAAAADHIAGYATFIDVSARAWQLQRGGQWVKGKSYPGFAPLGPWLVSRDEVPDPRALRLWLAVNGQRRQDSSTAEMVFPALRLVSYLSQFMALEAGDIIATGTPAGVGLGMKPEPVYLQPGDVVTAGIAGLGEQDHRVEAPAADS